LRDLNQREHDMSNVVKLYTIPEKLAEDEQLRLRALAPQDFGFEGLHSQSAMVLNQLELARKVPRGTTVDPENPIDYGGESA
jgi:hypothetical protein